MYCLLNGELPFEGSSLSQILSAQLTKKIEADGEGGTQRPLMKIVKRMLEKNPRDRYQSITSVVDDLNWLEVNDSEQQLGEFVAGLADVRDSITVPKFVGRTEERARIRQMIDEVRDGASRFVLVKGESGFGKSRLVGEAVSEASLLGMQVFLSEAAEQSGDCLLYTSPSPRDQRGSRMPSSA